MADILLANTVTDKNISGKLYDAVVVSRDDKLGKGRLEVKVPQLLGDSGTIWVNSIQPYGGLTITAIPPNGQEIKVYFNGTIEEGYWFGGNIKKGSIIDPDMILISDDKGNSITWQRKTGDIKVNSIGPVSLISKSSVTIEAPTINLKGDVKCLYGASGLITNLSSVVSKSGIVTQIS